MHACKGGPHCKAFTYGCSGRKKAALAYAVTYTSGCITKHFNDFNVLFVGRLLSGVATSLLYTAFESWLVAEHKKVTFLHLVLIGRTLKIAASVMAASLFLGKLPAAAELSQEDPIPASLSSNRSATSCACICRGGMMRSGWAGRSPRQYLWATA
jgi:hypothetical protein